MDIKHTTTRLDNFYEKMRRAARILREILKEANPTEYARWQGNCCRQMAMLTKMTVRDFLPEAIESFQLFESVFKNKDKREWSHSYSTIKYNNQVVTMDFSQQIKRAICFIWNPPLHSTYPILENEYMRKTHAIQIRYEELEHEHRELQTEYYTDDSFVKIYRKVIAKMETEDEQKAKKNI